MPCFDCGYATKREKPKIFQKKNSKVFRKGVIKGTIKNEINDVDTEDVIQGCTFVYMKSAKYIYFILDTCVYDKRVLFDKITS